MIEEGTWNVTITIKTLLAGPLRFCISKKNFRHSALSVTINNWKIEEMSQLFFLSMKLVFVSISSTFAITKT